MPKPETTIETIPLTVATFPLKVPGSIWGAVDVVTAGWIEVWVCSNCGYAEWYAQGMNEALGRLAQSPETGVRLVDTSGQRGPFR